MSLTAPPVPTVPVDSLIECLFCFTSRTLSAQETQTFLAGGGLPSGVGVDPATVLFDYQAPASSLITLTAASVPPVVRDAAGAYHVELVVQTPGLWWFRGRGLDSSADPLAATFKQQFLAQ